MRICRLFISPGHNYFGHHGRSPDLHPALEVREVECVAGQGLRGDRFFGFKERYAGQVTFFSGEVFEEVCRQLFVPGTSPGVTRRNIITREVDLNALIGKRFSLQNLEFEGVSECSPCYWMNRAIAPGAEAALRGRGGLRARVLSNGLLRLTE